MHQNYNFLHGGGKMGNLIRNKDWEKSSLGGIETWPQGLLSILSVALNASFPVCIYWGNDHILLYNDLWSAIPAQKHPWCLGQKAVDVWPEIWPRIGPMIKKVMETGQADFSSNELLLFKRGDYFEETYFDYTFSPIRCERGQVCGIFNAGLETTSHVLSARRTKLVQTLFNAINLELTEEVILKNSAKVLSTLPQDIPFFLLYNNKDNEHYLVAKSDFEDNRGAALDFFHNAISSAKITVHDAFSKNLLIRLENSVSGSVEALVLPLGSISLGTVGYLIVGISPHRKFDDDYNAFFKSIAGQLSSAFANSRVLNSKNHATEQLRKLFLKAPVAIAVLHGPNFIVDVANDRILEIWGRTSDEIQGQFLFDVLTELQGTPIYSVLKAVYDTGERFVGGEYDIRLFRKGVLEQIYVNFVYEPLFNESGNVYGIICVAVEITEQVKARLKAQDNAEVLSELMLQKDEFLSIASHELKTPLTSLKAYIQLCERIVAPNDKAFTFVNKAGGQLERLEKLIADLLDVSKINAGKIEYDIESFDMDLLISECVQSVQHTTFKHEILIQESSKVRVKGDRLRLEQVIINFLTNAVKYSPDASKVIVKCRMSEIGVLVSVQDFGIGIDAAHLDRIFERFYRVESTAMKYQGLGLGLFISSEIIKRHGGHFWIESKIGQGSTFFFLIPAEQP